MTKTFEDIQSLVSEMVKGSQGLRQFDTAVDSAVRLEWEVPKAVSRIEGFRKYVSTAPYDVISAATRTLAAVMPNLSIDPITIHKTLTGEVTDIDSDTARVKANGWERALVWALQQADKRVVTLIQDIVKSPFKYDRVALQVIYLPYQIASIEASGGNAMRYKAMLRQGAFAVKVHHPSDVHTRHSVYGLEAVCLTTVCAAQEIIDTYGKDAAKLKAKLNDEDCPDEWVLVEYTDYDTHAIWCIPGDDVEKLARIGEDDPTKEKSTIVILEPEKPVFPFLNGWVCVRGGTTLEKSLEHQHNSLLYSMIQSRQWENVNLAGSIRHTDAIITAGKPRMITEGPNPDEGVKYSYDKLGGEMQVFPGHKATPIPRDGPNPEMESLYQNDVADLSATAVSRTLVTSDVAPGETFSGFDLRVKMAVASLIPYKKTAERALDEIFTTMLLWIHYSKIDLETYGKGKKNGDYERYVIKAGDIDPECIHIESELVTDQPIDRIQQINAAIQMAQFLKVPVKYILEYLGVTDPESMLDDYYREQAATVAWEGKMQVMAAEVNGTLDQMATQKAQEMLAQMAQQSGINEQPPNTGSQPGMPMGGEGLPPEMAGLMGNPNDLTGGAGVPGASGQGFNAAMGGIPSSQVNPPGSTFEGATGMSRGGNEL